METLLQGIQGFASWKQVLRVSCKSNGLKTSLANTMTPIKVRGLYERLLKTYDSNQEKSRTCWFENELRAYHWLLLVLSSVNKVPIVDFTSEQWKLLSEIFKYKELHVLEYEAIRLHPKKSELARPWNKEEDDVLKEVISTKQVTNKWNDVARTLFKASDCKFYRTGKQCRERWLNHLDPNKKRGDWTEEEDKTIASYIVEQGKKWSEIARTLGQSRTQHMVKNRFKSLIIRQKKRHPSLKDETELLKTALTEVYVKNQILSSESEIESLSDIQDVEVKFKEEEIYRPEQKANCLSLLKETSKKQSFVRVEKSQKDRFSPNCDLTELDPALRNELIQNDNSDRQERGNKQYEMQQVFSPFCVPYTPTANMTPNYMSPQPSIPFFMSNFGQSCMNNFSFFLSQQSQNPNQNQN